jgi:hypoxanthine phosphoribosyltransferase
MKLTWEDVFLDCKLLADQIKSCDAILAVGRGGLIPGTLISYKFNVPIVNYGLQSYIKQQVSTFKVTQLPGIIFNRDYREERIVVIDDIADKGNTLIAIKKYLNDNEFTDVKFATLYTKPSSKFKPTYSVKEFADDIWLDFPWESSIL